MSNSTELLNRFSYHAPKGNQGERYEEIRETAREFSQKIVSLCPESEERANALNRLDEAVMWANASIARNE